MFPIKSQHAADPDHHCILPLVSKHIEVPGLHERTNKGIGWLGPLLVDSRASQAAMVSAPALQHTVPSPGLPPVSCSWSPLTSV